VYYSIGATMTLVEKLDPGKLGFSPKMAALVGAIIGHDYGARDPRGGQFSSLSITSDGFLIAATTSHESGAFVGSADDFKRNLDLLLETAKLTKTEREEFDALYRRNVTDWRS